MSLTRRGGHFYWLRCDACKECIQLVRWYPGARSGAQQVAIELVVDRVKNEGWRTNVALTRANVELAHHVCPYCVMLAEDELREQKRLIELPEPVEADQSRLNVPV